MWMGEATHLIIYKSLYQSKLAIFGLDNKEEISGLDLESYAYITHGTFDYAPHPSSRSSTVVSTKPLDRNSQCLQHHPLQPHTALTSRLKTP
jgi:hypothetical protein